MSQTRHKILSFTHPRMLSFPVFLLFSLCQKNSPFQLDRMHIYGQTKSTSYKLFCIQNIAMHVLKSHSPPPLQTIQVGCGTFEKPKPNLHWHLELIALCHIQCSLAAGCRSQGKETFFPYPASSFNLFNRATQNCTS